MDGALERARQLQEDVRRLAAAVADVAEESAKVHDDVAEVHDQLGTRSLLDPDALREQAVRERRFAAAEREVALGPPGGPRPGGPPPGEPPAR